VDTSTVARPKKAKPAPKPEPKTIAFRVSGEYGVWVDQLADVNQSNVATLLAQALAEYARKVGFTDPAPKR
jgi:hypothetical protein